MAARVLDPTLTQEAFRALDTATPTASAWELAHGATANLAAYDESGDTDGTSDDETETE